jgi:hypothetical protein
MPFHPQESRQAHTETGSRDYVAASSPSPSATPPVSGMRDSYPVVGRGATAGQQLIPAGFQAVRIGSALFPFTTCEAVSRAYRSTIERLGIGGSETPPCLILNHRAEVVGHVSYNGRIWLGAGADWQPGDRPLYAPNGHYGDPTELCRARAA